MTLKSHFLSLSWFTVIANEAHQSSVIRELDDMVSAVSGQTVVGHQGQQQWVEDATLRGIYAQSELMLAKICL